MFNFNPSGISSASTVAVKGNHTLEQRMFSQNILYSITEVLLSSKLKT